MKSAIAGGDEQIKPDDYGVLWSQDPSTSSPHPTFRDSEPRKSVDTFAGWPQSGQFSFTESRTSHPSPSEQFSSATRDKRPNVPRLPEPTDHARSLAEADDDDGTLYRVCVWFRWYSPATNDIIIFYLKPSRIHFPFGPRHAMPRHVCLGEGESARITNRNKSAVQISGSWFRFFFPSSH